MFNYIALEKKLLASNKEAVKNDLDNFLKTILLVCVVIFSALVGYFHYINPRFDFQILYTIGAFLSVVCLFVIYKIDSYEIHLATYYALITFVFCAFTYIGAIARPDGTATSIVVLLALFPILISDKFLRVNGFLLFFYLTFIAICFGVKPIGLAMEDFVNITGLTLIGFFIGNNHRKTKLNSFDIQRRSIENENIDFLTGLPNRRLMYLRIENSKKDKTSLPITGTMMIDIDHFKRYNDNKGHLKGDVCLKEIASLFSRISNEKGIEIFRYGGEEFVALYYEPNEEKMDYLAKYIIQEVRNLKIEFKECETEIITVSLGYTFTNVGENYGSNYLIDIADKALYLAKNAGRNRVVKI